MFVLQNLIINRSEKRTLFSKNQKEILQFIANFYFKSIESNVKIVIIYNKAIY